MDKGADLMFYKVMSLIFLALVFRFVNDMALFAEVGAYLRSLIYYAMAFLSGFISLKCWEVGSDERT